ncbi:MAG: hydroxymethylbilane synthase [Caldilineaceae bacterium]
MANESCGRTIDACLAWLALCYRALCDQRRSNTGRGKPLPSIGGKGLFTAELEASLRSGEIDLAVHSLKDLPVEESPGLTLGAITNRADVRDALVARNGWTLATLPPGATVGTSSTRRAAQLLAHRPDLSIRSIRGNVPTRARKVIDGEYGATLLAVAGLERLGLMAAVTELLPLTVMLPAPGQGALAVQCRNDDRTTINFLAALDDPLVRMAVTAERSFLHELGGGCAAPVAAHATVAADGTLQLSALVGSVDGKTIIRVVKEGSQKDQTAQAIGHEAAHDVLQQGAATLLQDARVQAIPKVDQAAVAQESFSLAWQGQPLLGKRVVVTRAEQQAASFVNALTALGATTLLVPTIRIAPLPDLTPLDRALQQLNRYRWLIVTSVNSVAILADRLAALQLQPADWAACKVAAVGQTTADALARIGLPATFVPEQYVADEIVHGLGEIARQRILLPQAEIARDTLATQLSERGATVETIPIYQTLAAELEPDAVAMLQHGVDLITFTSSSTVRNLVDAATSENGLAQTLSAATIACIGPVTAETARALGLHVDIVATEHTIPGLIDAIVAHYQPNPKPHIRN